VYKVSIDLGVWISPPILREHLAFNKDGTRLAWVVETIKGKTMRVFKVPK